MIALVALDTPYSARQRGRAAYRRNTPVAVRDAFALAHQTDATSPRATEGEQ